jgi:hypothetical protein
MSQTAKSTNAVPKWGYTYTILVIPCYFDDANVLRKIRVKLLKFIRFGAWKARWKARRLNLCRIFAEYCDMI